MYIAVFICFSSKAVHLELVEDLSSDIFISIFKRFIARRGLPQRVHCDNGTNFVGASRQLKELQEAFNQQATALRLFASEEGVEFVFTPPRAPHFGGLWESAVKLAKHHLVRSVGNANISVSEMTTVLCKVEAVLNSRPIGANSNDPNDVCALTPGHLLVGRAIRSLPQESAPDVPDNQLTCLRRCQLLCAIKQRFWRAWSKEYCHSLQERTKWCHEQPNLQVGQLVMIHDDNMPPQRWLIGRVCSTISGKDGKTRVAEVKTANGLLKRAIHKLALLPIY